MLRVDTVVRPTLVVGWDAVAALPVIRLVDAFLASDKIVVPTQFHQEPLRRRILLASNMGSIVRHLLRHIAEWNVERPAPVFDEEVPIGCEQARAKRAALAIRVQGVNAKGRFGFRCCDVAFQAA